MSIEKDIEITVILDRFETAGIPDANMSIAFYNLLERKGGDGSKMKSGDNENENDN